MLHENDHDYTADAPGTERLVENPKKSACSEGGEGGEGVQEPKIRELPPVTIVEVLGEDFLYIHGKIWIKLTNEVLHELRARSEARLRQLSTPQAD